MTSLVVIFQLKSHCCRKGLRMPGHPSSVYLQLSLIWAFIPSGPTPTCSWSTQLLWAKICRQTRLVLSRFTFVPCVPSALCLSLVLMTSHILMLILDYVAQKTLLLTPSPDPSSPFHSEASWCKCVTAPDISTCPPGKQKQISTAWIQTMNEEKSPYPPSLGQIKKIK